MTATPSAPATSAPVIKIGRRSIDGLTVSPDGTVFFLVVARRRGGDMDPARSFMVHLFSDDRVDVDSYTSDRFGESFYAECERISRAVLSRASELRAASLANR